jgi:hypothetical protein
MMTWALRLIPIMPVATVSVRILLTSHDSDRCCHWQWSVTVPQWAGVSSTVTGKCWHHDTSTCPAIWRLAQLRASDY